MSDTDDLVLIRDAWGDLIMVRDRLMAEWVRAHTEHEYTAGESQCSCGAPVGRSVR